MVRRNVSGQGKAEAGIYPDRAFGGDVYHLLAHGFNATDVWPDSASYSCDAQYVQSEGDYNEPQPFRFG